MPDKNLKIRILTNYLISTVSIVLVLMIIGLVSLFFLNTKDLVRKARENIIITIFLKNDISTKEINNFVKELKKTDFVRTVKFTSAEEALDDIEAALGEDIRTILEYNPLPPSVDITLKENYANPDSLFFIKNRLLQNMIVSDVFYNQSIVNQLDRNVRLISAVLLGFATIIFVISFFLIINTIRLSIFARRSEIKIMQLFGASWWFILKPFFRKGFFHGIISSLLALLLLIGVLIALKFSIEDFKVSFLAETFFIVFILGTLTTLFATIITVFSFIFKPTENLYV